MKMQNVGLRPRLRPAVEIRLGFLLLVSLLGRPESGEAQVQPQAIWAVTNGSGSMNVMLVDRSGNTITAGNDDGDYLTVKRDPNGNMLWSSRQPGRQGTYFGVTAMATEEAGNVYVTGGLVGSRSYTATFCDFDGCHNYKIYVSDQVTVKYNSNGQRQWTATYLENGDSSFYGTAIAVDPEGNVYVTGAGTFKYDSRGNQIWRTNVFALAMILDSTTNLCLTGNTGTRKLDRNGNQLWSVPIYGSELKSDAEGNLYVSLSSSSFSPLGVTTKLDRNGSILWTASFGGRLAFAPDDSVFAARPSWVVKLDRHGTPVWQAYDSSLIGNPPSLAVDEGGSVYVPTSGSSGGRVIRLAPDGIRTWAIPSGYSSVLTLDSAGLLYVAAGSVLTKYQQVITPGTPVITGPLPHPLVRLGDIVSLNVNVTGAAPLGYLWRTIPSSVLMPISQRTNATLTLVNVQTNHAGMYSVEVTNSLGSAASPGFFVSVLSPLPSQTVVLGSTAVFRTPLSRGGPADYQWQFNGVDLPGENRATLAVPNVGPSHVGDYSVVVSNHYGNALTSTVARLSLDRRVIQAWAATLPGGNVGDVDQAIGLDSAGNVFVTGYSDCGHKTVKYDATGEELWVACDNQYKTTYLGGLAVDRFGNVGVAGTVYSSPTNSDFDISLTKYSPTGSTLWNVRSGGVGSGNDVADAIAVDDTGNFYVAGSSLYGTNGHDFIALKYSPSGQQLWAVGFDGPGHGNDFATAVAADDVGNAYVGGYSQNTNGALEFALIKYDSSGIPVWTNRYNGPGPGNDVPSDIVVDTTGNVYITGWSPGIGTLTDFATIKYDANGAQLWVARYNGPGNHEDNPHGLAVDAAGNVYVTGSSVRTNRPIVLYDIATVKYAPDGTQLWVRRYNGPSNGQNYSRALALDAAGNVYVEGHSDSSPNRTTEVVTLSYDTDGNERWIARYDTGVQSTAYYRNGSLRVDGAGIVYVADTTFDGTTSSFLTLKYVQPPLVRLMAPVVLPGGQLRCTLRGEGGNQYTIQASSDLVNWIPLTTVVADGTGSIEFTDTTTPGSSHRFYRAVQP